MKAKQKNISSGDKRFLFVIFFFFLFLIPFLYVSQELEGFESPGELCRVHSDLEGAKKCGSCHTEDETVDTEKCLNCHIDLKKRISAKKGYHQDKNEGCEMCHTEHQGVETSLIDWDISDFDHSETGYELVGSHKKIKDCKKCHKSPNQLPRKKSRSFLLKSSSCSACHVSPHPGKYPDCTFCHTSESWTVNTW